MKSNIYYFDEKGNQKNYNHKESIKNELSKKQLKEIDKLKGKSYLNIFFYAWFLIVIIFIICYMLLYYKSISEDNHNKTLIKNKETLNTLNKTKVSELNETNISNKKIGIAFVFKENFINEIESMLLYLMNQLAINKKYDIYIIANQNNTFKFKFNKNIKIIYNLSNKTYIKDFDKNSNIKFYVLNNELSLKRIKYFQSLNEGKKLIGIMNGGFLSYSYGNKTEIYSLWKRNFLYDAYINMIPDDYYIYKNIGMNNTFFIPYLYNFNQKSNINSNLTYKNLLIIGPKKDHLKGAIYGIKAMSIIKQIISEAKLYFITSSYLAEIIENLIKNLNLTKNIEILYDVKNLTNYYLNSSVLLYPSLSEYYPYIMNEAKFHAIPIVGFNLSYNPSYLKGVIKVDMFNYSDMAQEAIKLLNNYEYRKIKGLEAKLSLNEFTNFETIEKWEKLFSVLENNDPHEYKIFQDYTYKEYYNEKIAIERLQMDFNLSKGFNKYFCCHSFNNMLKFDYIKNITVCQNINICK